MTVWTNSSSRLNTGPKTGATASFFVQAKSGTKYETIYRTNMDNSSFNPYYKSVDKTIQGSNQAFYGRSSKISGHECEVKISLHSYYKNIKSFTENSFSSLICILAAWNGCTCEICCLDIFHQERIAIYSIHKPSN